MRTMKHSLDDLLEQEEITREVYDKVFAVVGFHLYEPFE